MGKKRIITQQIDLHRVKHEEAKGLIEDYILQNSLPIRIITGHSSRMREIVVATLIEHGFVYESIITLPYITVLK